MDHHDEIDALADDEAMIHIAEMLERASDTQDEGLAILSLRLTEQLAKRKTLSDENQAILHYYRSNAFCTRLSFSGQRQNGSWDIPYFQEILLELRRCTRHDGWRDFDSCQQCQYYTNLGNRLNFIGRPIEALAYWDRAIELYPKFVPALGSRGNGLDHYGQVLFDPGHRRFFRLSTYDSFLRASALDAVFDSKKNLAYQPEFVSRAKQIADSIDIDATRSNMCEDYSLGESKAERDYRLWCLENRLFLNPLNDLGTFSIAAHDVFHLPSLTVDIKEGPKPPSAFGFYNQLKQEFVSARWMYYEGLSHKKPHFSDKDVCLYDTLNSLSYSLETEKTKIAFRMAYSLFDKIAVFINDYFKVGWDEGSVSFRRVWYQHKKGKHKGTTKLLNNNFKDSQNWLLRGLYWLSKDIYEPTFQEVSEPDAERLNQLRNYLEHRYCQVHEDMEPECSLSAISQNGSSCLHIGRDVLELKCLRILKLVRSALIYLSLAVHREETHREETVRKQVQHQ